MADPGDIAIGIDLGTSYSCVSILENGQTTVIPNEWGERTHASVVSFLEDGTVLVGNSAKRNIITNADNTVYSAKRLIGRFYFSDEVKKAQAVMPYKIVEGEKNPLRIQIRENIYSLPEISALVLKEMKSIVENYVGHEVKKEVVTVPAYFNDNQPQATKDAGRIAGLDVLRILNEPTAAALAYGFGKDITQKIAVYDLGGGTFDISVLEIGKDVFEVLSTAGDTYLGGDDFDDRIMTWLAEGFLKQHGIDLRLNKYCLQMLKEASERAKIDVGRDGVSKIQVEGICQDPAGKVMDLAATLSEAEFNKMVMDLVQRTFKVCDEALQSAKMTAQDLDAVILVRSDGSRRHPQRSRVQQDGDGPGAADLQGLRRGAAEREDDRAGPGRRHPRRRSDPAAHHPHQREALLRQGRDGGDRPRRSGGDGRGHPGQQPPRRQERSLPAGRDASDAAGGHGGRLHRQDHRQEHPHPHRAQQVVHHQPRRSGAGEDPRLPGRVEQGGGVRDAGRVRVLRVSHRISRGSAHRGHLRDRHQRHRQRDRRRRGDRTEDVLHDPLVLGSDGRHDQDRAGKERADAARARGGCRL